MKTPGNGSSVPAFSYTYAMHTHVFPQMNRPIGAESVILMSDYLNSVSIPVIVTVVYVIIDLVKTTIAPYTTLSERLSHFYPLIALALGIVTAAVMYYAVPESITQTNLLVALAIGAASGLTAVGTNQVVKQLAKTTEDTASTSDTSADEESSNG